MILYIYIEEEERDTQSLYVHLGDLGLPSFGHAGRTYEKGQTNVATAGVHGAHRVWSFSVM